MYQTELPVSLHWRCAPGDAHCGESLCDFTPCTVVGRD